MDRRARRVKTDRLDLEQLIRMLLALERGETRACRVVRVPSPAEEDAKRQHRERAVLVAERRKTADPTWAAAGGSARALRHRLLPFTAGDRYKATAADPGAAAGLRAWAESCVRKALQFGRGR